MIKYKYFEKDIEFLSDRLAKYENIDKLVFYNRDKKALEEFEPAGIVREALIGEKQIYTDNANKNDMYDYSLDLETSYSIYTKPLNFLNNHLVGA